MKSKMLKVFKLSQAVAISISMSLISVPSVSFAAGEGAKCEKMSKEAVDACNGAAASAKGASDQAAAALSIKASNETNVPLNAFDLANLSIGSAAALDKASNYCKTEALNYCSKNCDTLRGMAQQDKVNGPAEVKKIDAAKSNCQSGIGASTSDLDKGSKDLRQSASEAEQTGSQALGDDTGSPSPSGGGGGMSPMMAGLLGAAAGGLAGYLLGSKKKKDKEKEESVVDENGVVNCSKAGAEAYSDCNDHFVTQCSSDTTTTSCQTFSNRYCSGTSKTTGAPSVVDPTSGAVVIASATDKDISGEGVGSQFCFNAQASSFCAASSSRSKCPSCLQLETNKSEACKSNPSLCVAQNSTADVEAAKTSCPSDPLFSNPAYANGGGSTVPTNMQSSEIPVIPTASNSGTSADSTPTAPEIAGVASVNKGSSSGMVVSSVGSGSNITGTGSVIGGASRDVASSGVVSGSASAAASGSALKVLPQIGPSLFAVSSEMISSRCKQGKLVHCDK